MSAADYIATFASIVVGLAFADLLISFHRLVRARRTIQWDWLPVASAFLVLLTIVQVWWRFFDIWAAQTTFAFGQFLPDLFSLSLLFLLAATALPDDVQYSGLDLRRYYLDNRTYFWGLFAAYVLVVSMIRFGRRTGFDASLDKFLDMNGFNLVAAALMVTLAVWKHRWLHGIVIAIFTINLTVTWIQLTIQSPQP